MARNLPVEIILLQIAEGLQSLVSNKDLSKTISDAYALSQSEQAKANDSRNIIAQADQFMTDLKSKQDALADVNERIAKAEKIEAFNEDTLRMINAKKNDLDKQQSQNTIDATANALENQRLQNVQSALDARAEALKDSEDEVAQIRADLQKRANAVKDQISGL